MWERRATIPGTAGAGIIHRHRAGGDTGARCGAIMKPLSQESQAEPAGDVQFRPAVDADLDALLRIEERAYATDRLSRRSFRRWIGSDHRISTAP